MQTIWDNSAWRREWEFENSCAESAYRNEGEGCLELTWFCQCEDPHPDTLARIEAHPEFYCSSEMDVTENFIEYMEPGVADTSEGPSAPPTSRFVLGSDGVALNVTTMECECEDFFYRVYLHRALGKRVACKHMRAVFGDKRYDEQIAANASRANCDALFSDSEEDVDTLTTATKEEEEETDPYDDWDFFEEPPAAVIHLLWSRVQRGWRCRVARDKLASRRAAIEKCVEVEIVATSEDGERQALEEQLDTFIGAHPEYTDWMGYRLTPEGSRAFVEWLGENWKIVPGGLMQDDDDDATHGG